ncbi:cAMP-regulated phosphoprotein 19 [Apostichopus japonicus]|uniref:cAMP-regulated phosphoprotein 19 n=1 Tax=Stichopus japonicus TaxID=307972 RepID=A0A2G8K2K7_STIJA|nr:cAMP-regulated phosphoprotein 19 [Apostichopus japonicus]
MSDIPAKEGEKLAADVQTSIKEEESLKAESTEKTPQALEAEKLANLKKKFGNVGKPGGSDFLRKKLNKVKYFDSGDYQMAKQTGNLQPGRRGNGKPPLVQTGATGQAHPTPASMPHRKVSSEVSKLAV